MFIHMGRLFTSVVLGVCLVATASAQRFSFRSYAEGLGNLNVTTTLQDATGFLWVGTQSGLFRYDGSRFLEFGPAQGLNDTFVLTMFADPKGTLWVGTGGGLYFLNAEQRFEQVRYQGRSLKMAGGSKIAKEPDGTILAAAQAGLFRLRQQGEAWQAEAVETESDDSSSQYVWSVLVDLDGSIWFGCGENLCQMAGGIVSRWGQAEGVPAAHWTDLMRDSRGEIWMRADEHLGVFLPRPGRFEAHDLPGLTAGSSYLPMVEDKQGRILTGGGMSLARFVNGSWQVLGAAQGLSRTTISTVMVDKEGSVWLGLVGHGLEKWLGQDQWSAWTSADGLANDIVWAALRDSRGRLWVGTEGGISYMPEGSTKLQAWSQADVDAARTMSLAESRDGFVWAGTGAGKLIQINLATLRGTVRSVPHVRRLTVDSRDRVWMATDHGLFVSEAGGTRAFHLVDNPDLRDRVGDVREGPGGEMWTASNRALYRMDDRGWHRVQFDFAKAGIDRVDEVAPSPSGDVLLEGNFQGIRSLAIVNDKVQHVDLLNRPTLLSEAVDFINFDARGWLWVGQDHGVIVYDGHAWRKFTQDSGLIWNDCSQDAFFADRDGSVWIGTAGGLAHLNNPLAVSTGAPPAPILVSAMLGNQTVSYGARFKWKQDALTIGMASLTFRDVGAIRFHYRLVGVDTDWVTVRSREARYPALAPGSYRFQAVAVDTANNTESDVKELAFEIVPPWWQSTTFYVVSGLLIAGACILAWRRRVTQLLMRQQELESAVSERTRELEREKGELVVARERLKALAAHDGLTGLWNRRTILEHLDGELERARRENASVAVIMADVDFFKRINDAYGHVVGDAVLRETAERFSSAMRSYDHVGRYGGEEFLFVLPNCDMAIAIRRAEDLRRALSVRKFVAGINRLEISASFGVAVSEGGRVTADSVVRAADAALYFAKQQGRDRVETMETAEVLLEG